MTILIKLTLSLAFVLSIVIPFGTFLLGEKNKKRLKSSLGVNIFFFFGTMVVASVMMMSQSTYAAGEAVSNSSAGLGYIAAALSTGLACIGGGVAVSAAASAALGAISEDSSVLGKSLIFVGLAEGVCLYGLIIAFMILAKI